MYRSVRSRWVQVRLIVAVTFALAAGTLLTNVEPVAGQGPPVPTPPPGRQPLSVPPTNEPGWISVAGRQEITFPDGARVFLGNQSNVPEEQRIAWVRRAVDAGPPPPTYKPPPRPRPTSPDSEMAADDDRGADSTSTTQATLSHETQATTNFCDVFNYCAIVTDYSLVYYYKAADGTFQINSCYTATGRTWNNPYNLPQFSYDKVKAHVSVTGAGGYAPASGQVQAYTYTYIAPCFTYNYSAQYGSVSYGSRWNGSGVGSRPESLQVHYLP